MTTILLTITIVSFIMTIALAALVVKLLRDERRRSAARVAALAQMADVDSPADAILGTTVGTETDWTINRDDRPSRSMPGSGDLFTVPETRAAWPRRLGVAAAIVAIVAVTGLILRSRTPVDHRAAAETAAAGASSTQAGAMLELLSLKHTQEAKSLTITGLVQNPRDGVALSKVAVTAFLFGADGTFLASGRAPLDFTVLRPGDESGFVVNVPVTTPVARYRIGFRGDDGRIIGHVDRRGANSIALSESKGIAHSSLEPSTARGPS